MSDLTDNKPTESKEVAEAKPETGVTAVVADDKKADEVKSDEVKKAEPKLEKGIDEVKADTAKVDEKKTEVPKSEPSKPETVKPESPKSDDKPSDENKAGDKKADEKPTEPKTETLKTDDKKSDEKKADEKPSEIKADDKKIDEKADVGKATGGHNSQSSRPKQGFGEALALARKKKSMSVDDVAQRLNRLRRQIEAIEAEDYESLPQYAFAKGFAGSYARLVGLDDAEIGRQFDAGYPNYLRGDSVEDIHSPLRPMGTLKRDRMPIRLNAGLIAGIVAVLIFGVAMLKMINNATKSDSEVAVQGEQVADSLSPNEQAIGAAVGDTPVVIGSTGTALTGSAVGATAGAGVLDFWLKESTNIKVVDSTGVTLMTGEQKKGGYQLTGKPPFKIEITQPSRVDLNFNKNPVNLASHTKGNKAVFTLQ